MSSWWNATCLIVEVSRNMVLQEFPQILDNQLRSTSVAILAKSLIDSQHVDHLVGQIVL